MLCKKMTAYFQRDRGSFQWPILIAAVVAGLVFFVIGVLVSMLFKDRSTKKVSLNI